MILLVSSVFILKVKLRYYEGGMLQYFCSIPGNKVLPKAKYWQEGFL